MTIDDIIEEITDIQIKVYHLSLLLTKVAYDPKQVRDIAKRLQELLK